MRVRPLKETDLEAVRRLRNADRAAFFDSREISPEDQRRWFAELPASVSFYVLEEEGEVIGAVSLTDQGPDGIEVGNVLLDRCYRGRGLMTAAIRDLCAGPARYFARILPGNTASQSLFGRVGFTESYRTYHYGGNSQGGS